MKLKHLAVMAFGVPAIGFAHSFTQVIASLIISTTMEPMEQGSAKNDAVVPGVVTMNTAPWTKVIIDGETRGSTPLFRVRLMPGQHTVKFVNEEQNISQEAKFEVQSGYLTKLRGALAVGEAAGSKMEQKSRPVEVEKNAGDLTDPAFLTVDSKPWSRVFVDGKLIGTTPLLKFRVAPGAHAIELRNAEQGFLRRQNVELQAGEVQKVVLEETPLPADYW